MNCDIKIDNKPVFYRDWFEKRILYVNDIVSENGDFYTLEQLHNIFNISLDIMKYNSIISSVKEKSNMCTKEDRNLTCPFIPSTVYIIIKSNKGAKDMYCLLNKNFSVPGVVTKWNNFIELSDLEWKNIFKLPFIITKNTKLQWLQYRINHRILATNKFLFRIKILDDPNCCFCGLENESIEHLFWDCELVQIFLEQLENLFLENGISIPFTKKYFLFGNTARMCKGDAHNMIYFCVKQYIYNTRYFKKSLCVQSVIEKLKYQYSLEKMIAVKNKSLNYFNHMWNNFETLLG